MVGRPKTKIDKQKFEKLCQMQCTLEEIADFFECCDDTINNWCKAEYADNFSGVYKKKSVAGKISLRRNMFKLSEKNPTMAIWLSKQHLGMKDNIEVESTQLVKVEELLNKIENEASK